MDTNKINALQDKIVHLDKHLRRIANSVSGGDPLEADDVYGEMVVTIITKSDPEDSNSRILTRGRWTALTHVQRHAVEDKYFAGVVQIDPHTHDALDTDDEDDSEFSAEDSIFTVHQNPESAVVTKEMMAMLMQIVSNMAPEYQTVVRLLSQGNNQVEVATKMGITKSAVSMRVKTIRETLSSCGITPSFA